MPAHHVPHSETTRLEAFSDAVFAIVITIMVLEFKVPHEMTTEALRPLTPIFFSYALSFIYLAIYWNNHHHLLHATEGINGKIMWANMHLLFWLSLIPFATGWVGESHGETVPAALYGSILLMAAFAYLVLQWAIVKNQGRSSKLAQALGTDLKEILSLTVYAAGVLASLFYPLFSYGLYALVAVMWFIPDKRLAPLFDHEENH